MASAVFSLLLCGLGSTAAHAGTGSDLYVDAGAAGCSDSGPGSQAEPFCQVQPAVDAATAGTTVHVARAAAYEPVTISALGTADDPVTVIGGDGTSANPATLLGTGTSAVTFSGARYVTMTGFVMDALGATAVTIADAQHVDLDTGRIRSVLPAGDTSPTVSVDGASSDVSLTQLNLELAQGRAFAAAAGARDITLADDTISTTGTGTGISAVGTDGIVMAADTLTTYCGNAVSLTGGTSGSLENTVIGQPGASVRCPTDDPGKIAVDAESAPKVTADYNAVNPSFGGRDYTWAGAAYSTSAAFHTGTGQGAHDLDQTNLTLTSAAVAEHSPLIDSGDATAPGEPATDQSGSARTDDPLVADSGNGGGHYDRGSREFQDPLRISRIDVPQRPYAGKPYTFSADLSDPWSSASDLTYAFDFGDGQTLKSATPTVTHTYTDLGSYRALVTATRANGTVLPSAGASVEVQPIVPLTETISCFAVPSAPLATTCDLGTVTSYYPAASGRTGFGDGTAAVLDAGGNQTLSHVYAAPGAYTVTRTVTDSAGRTATAAATVVVGSSYVPISPSRVLDTRDGTGAAKKKIGPGGVVRVKVVGLQNAPTAGVTAVILNVTDVNATSSSVITAYPDGAARPTASNLNFLAGRINPNLVTVPVSRAGYVDLHNAFGSVDLVADVEGYYFDKAYSDLTNTAPVDPVRVLDTRNGTGARQAMAGPGSLTSVTLPGASGTATHGALLHVTVTGGTGNGFLSVFCGSDYPPTASNLNYRAGQTVSNLVAVCVYDGVVRIYNSGASVHLIADLQALMTDDRAGTPRVDTTSPRGLPFVPSRPTRILDTRSGVGSPAGAVGANGTVALKVAGIGAVPAAARAVMVNLTGTGPTTSTYLTAYGEGPLPVASTLNLARGETRPALTLIPVDADGYIHIRNFSGSVHLVADLEGYFG
ncbi:PKD domain-containing protein [Actinacidiphila paucisporea]|uniref:PKD repeat-containing protein n=1 Tax=Actinacidiphila paucisporea TaxID=310782 RepID=A0A1M7N4U8_9ACTN|nr:PKD domain-containing protein [Actinacidiphila paucisporea]SHM98500.1 PKD repeat-containing protein [Actinacidiphila paucisporea]